MLGLKRDIILRLFGYCKTERKSKLQNMLGMCQEIYEWRNHYLFDKTKNYAFRVKYKDNYAYGKRNEEIDRVCGDKQRIILFSSMTVDGI
jgi:hypothetical protein